MKKVIVIGCPGSGKSTFSKHLHKATGLPLFHLDMLYWNPDKTTVDKTVFSVRLADVLQKGAWIIDGNYHSTLETRLERCDTVFFLDYPLELCLNGIKSRKGKPRSDMPWIETEEDKELLGFVERYSSDCRPHVLSLLDGCWDKDIYIFKSRQEADSFLQHL